jgi:hypothetical protein
LLVARAVPALEVVDTDGQRVDKVLAQLWRKPMVGAHR